MIARHCPGAQVAKAIYRTRPVESQCTRHKHGLGPISADQHHFARTRKTLTLRQTYFVDNVTTSGHTLEAARAAFRFRPPSSDPRLPRGMALAYPTGAKKSRG
jgi:hypothetical protein